jgi:regulatory protein
MTADLALQKAQSLCSKQERCISEIREKLNVWEVKETDAEKIIRQLVAEKFINESRYAAFFTHDKFRFNKWGKVKIRIELKRKNIPPDAIADALESIPAEEYENLIETELQKKKRTITAKNKWDAKAKLMRFAMSRGFESELVSRITDRLLQ